MKIIQGRFKVRASRKKYEEDAKQHIKRMMDTPGLIWKIWAFDEEKNEALGVYYFRDDKIAQMVYDNMDPKTWPNYTYDIELRIWDIQEELCRFCNVSL